MYVNISSVVIKNCSYIDNAILYLGTLLVKWRSLQNKGLSINMRKKIYLLQMIHLLNTPIANNIFAGYLKLPYI